MGGYPNIYFFIDHIFKSLNHVKGCNTKLKFSLLGDTEYILWSMDRDNGFFFDLPEDKK